MYDNTRTIKEYFVDDALGEVNIDELGERKAGDLAIEVIDSVADYVELMKSIFDFDHLRAFVARNTDFKILLDAMNGGAHR